VVVTSKNVEVSGKRHDAEVAEFPYLAELVQLVLVVS